MVSARSMIVRAAMPFCGYPVSALNHSINGVTCWVIPIASVFACILCHSLEAYRNGSTDIGCTRERGDRDAQGTETLSILRVSLVI